MQPLWIAGGGMTDAGFSVTMTYPSQRAALEAVMAGFAQSREASTEMDLIEIRPNAGAMLIKQAEDNFGNQPADATWSRSWQVSYGYMWNGYIHRWVRDGGDVLFTIKPVS